MTEKDYYIRLLQQMTNASRNLDNTLSQIDKLKIHLKDAITINEEIYRKQKIEDLKANVITQRDRINGVIIPAIRNKIDSIEE